ncbi:MAG: hypothetical protein C5S47_01730 [Candidatus Methanogasteraceae archaeon]|nr:MAG: hypothetical protein C5S47_01730 [ANME-2 cluster archaeon]
MGGSLEHGSSSGAQAFGNLRNHRRGAQRRRGTTDRNYTWSSGTDDESGVDTIVGNLTNTSGVSQDVDSGFAPEVGVYTLVAIATDNAGNTNVSDLVFFVVYDPNGGHATGGGWFFRMKTAHFRTAEPTLGSQPSTRAAAPQAS